MSTDQDQQLCIETEGIHALEDVALNEIVLVWSGVEALLELSDGLRIYGGLAPCKRASIGGSAGCNGRLIHGWIAGCTRDVHMDGRCEMEREIVSKYQVSVVLGVGQEE